MRNLYKIFSLGLLLCSSLVSSSVDLRDDAVVIENQTYFKVRDEESVQNGFVFATERGATAQDLLKKIKDAQSRSLRVSYKGHFVDKDTSTISEITHFSIEGERWTSTLAALNFVRASSLWGAFLCMDFEDFADFEKAELVSWKDRVYPGRPKRYSAQALCAGEGRFSVCLKKYVDSQACCAGRPIVFCSSGRSGFCGAGEFLYQLLAEEYVWEKKPHVYFLFTAIQLSGQSRIDARKEIALAAATADHNNHSLDYWLDIFDVCVEGVECHRVYPGKVVFVQDAENIFMGSATGGALARLNAKDGPYDILVGHVSGGCQYSETFYCMQHAYRLSEELGACCITGHEDVEDLPDRKSTTLIYATTKGFRQNEYTVFFTQSFGYKKTVRLEDNFGPVRSKSNLIVGGCIMPEACEDTTTVVLFSRACS